MNAKPHLQRAALREILNVALEREADGAGCGPYLSAKSETVLEALVWIDDQGFLDDPF